MNTEHLSRGWALIAEGAQYISLAYASIEPPLAQSGVPATPAASPEVGPPPPASGPSDDDLPPLPNDLPSTTTWVSENVVDDTGAPVLKPQVEAGLGRCPVHGKPWTVAPAGVSKRTGKEYDAFFKCDSKDGDEFCKQKPQKIWRDLHPIPNGVAA